MRALSTLAVLVVALAGCDASDDALAPIDDVVLVSVVPDSLVGRGTGTVLSLRAERYAGCNAIATDTQSRVRQATVTVRGLVNVFDCRLDIYLGPSRTSVLVPPVFGFPLEVSIRHRGATDRYRLTRGEAGVEIEALETRTTRAAPYPGYP